MNVDLRRRRTGSPDAYRPWRIDHAAVVPQMALAIDHRDVEPAVVRAKPGRPDDGANLAAREIEIEPRRCRRAGRFEALRGPTSRIARVLRAHSSNVSSSRSIFRSASANWLRSPPENSARAVAHVQPAAPTISTPAALERVEIQRRALGRADQLRRRQLAAPASGRRSRRSAGSRRLKRPSTTARRVPRYVRGSRTCSPTDSVTGRGRSGGFRRQAARRWRDAPTTSTPPSGS